MVLPVLSVVTGDNSDLIARVARLYARQEHRIADLTWGKGVFWRKLPHLSVTGSDLVTVPERPYDFRSTPYADQSFDIVVLDPPYIHSPGRHITDRRYQNAATTAGMRHDDIRRLYAEGMREAMRICRPGGQVWVKCKDQVQAAVQRWAHTEILVDAQALGLYARDLFLLVPTSRTPSGRWERQFHARKVHSYLWVFTLGHGRLEPVEAVARRPPHNMVCIRCKAAFTAKRSDARYCGGACRVAAHRAS